MFKFYQSPTFYDTLKIHEQLRVKVTNLTAGRFSKRRMVDRDKFCFLNKGSVKVRVPGVPAASSPARYVIAGSIQGRTLRPAEQTLHNDKFTNFQYFYMPLVINIFPRLLSCKYILVIYWKSDPRLSIVLLRFLFETPTTLCVLSKYSLPNLFFFSFQVSLFSDWNKKLLTDEENLVLAP